MSPGLRDPRLDHAFQPLQFRVEDLRSAFPEGAVAVGLKQSYPPRCLVVVRTLLEARHGAIVRVVQVFTAPVPPCRLVEEEQVGEVIAGPSRGDGIERRLGRRGRIGVERRGGIGGRWVS